MGAQSNRVKFNVGGRVFETTSTTLANAGRDSFFGSMFDENWNLRSSNSGEEHLHFIDRNPDCFAVLLDLLRTGELHISPTVPEKLLYREASFYWLLDLVRSAKWGDLDGDRLKLFRSVSKFAPRHPWAIRAGPGGGCCVVQKSTVHVYDWLLEEHPPLNLSFKPVMDVCWLDKENILTSVSNRPGDGEGDMGLFSSGTGELKHRFHITHGEKWKSFTAGALSFDSDGKIYSSCRGMNENDNGIGVWDRTTGKQIDFFYGPQHWSCGKPSKLQWLSFNKCLLVASLYPEISRCYLSLLDFRAKSIVWSWYDAKFKVRIGDAIPMEEGSSICVANEHAELGFVDLRRRSAPTDITWNSTHRVHSCSPKLAWDGGKLFLFTEPYISVLSGPQWVLTSHLRRKTSSIYDLSIGGDRLFELHDEEDGYAFSVWETPPPVL